MNRVIRRTGGQSETGGSALLALCSMLLLAACGGGGGSGGGSGGGTGDDVGDSSGTPRTIAVDVAVVDGGGRAIPGAMVSFTSDSVPEMANDQGKVTGESELREGKLRLQASADDHLDQLRVLEVPAGAERVNLTLALTPLGQAIDLATAESGGSVTGALGTAVTVLGGSLVNDRNEAATGEVEARLTPLDLGDANGRQAFPAAFRGVADGGSEHALGAVAIADFRLVDEGVQLVLADGQAAEIRLPLTAVADAAGTPFTVGQSLPLWSLDEASGLWRQQGSGEVVADAAAPTGLALQATVSHFSWWLGAVVLEPAEFEVAMKCADPSGPCSAIEEEGGQVAFRTGEVGRPWFEQITLVPTLSEGGAVETELPVLPLMVFGRDRLGAFGGTNPAAIESAGGAYPPQVPLLLSPRGRGETVIELLPLHAIDGDWMGPRPVASLTGLLGTNGDTHEYTVPLRPNDTLRLEAAVREVLGTLGDGTASAGPAVGVVVTDPLGQVLADELVDSGGPLVLEVPADMGGDYVVGLVGTVSEGDGGGYAVDTTTVAGSRPIVAECRPYDPETDSAGAGNTWQNAEEQTETPYSIPGTQRGGGVVTATLSTGNAAIRPRLFACADGACADGSVVGHTATEGGPAKVQFEARVGTSYTFINDQFGAAPEDDYPVAHTLSIDFSPRVDCWEPNDTRAGARGIVLGEPIEAYMLEGFEDNFLRSGEQVDWYVADMRHPGWLEVDVSQPAGGHLMRVVVETEAGDSVLMENQQVVAGAPFIVTSTRARAPGLYWIRIGVLLQDNTTVSGNGDPPAHWDQKYKATVSRRSP